MPSYVADLLKRLFPPTQGRLLSIGLDAAGRTSWLYFAKLGEHVTTIPTIGFNVETIKHAGSELTIWDVGGCDKIRPLWRHYFQNTDGIIFLVDANDHDRMDEMGEELRRLAAEPALRDSFFLVIANKQDLPAALSAGQVSERLRLLEALRGRMWTCLPGRLGDRQMTDAHLDWIVSALRHPRKPQPPATDPARADAAPQAAGGGGGGGGEGASQGGAAGGGGESDVLERWLQVEDEPDDDFLRALEDYSLGSWDHRTHLRLAWLYLTRHGRREGLARIHASIRAFIQHSPLTRRKAGTTYHENMTYFWAHMVHFAIASQKVPPGAAPDFKLFLLMNPQLSNGGLFLHYYTKKLMLESPESRARVVLPDKRPLPSIITDLAALSLSEDAKRPQAAAPPPAAPPSDAEFLTRFLSRRLDRWNHECLLRSIYCCLSRHGRRRGGNVALDALRAMQGEGFHLTVNYFWVCMLTYTLASEHATALFGERAPASPEAVQADVEATSGGTVGGGGAEAPSQGRSEAEMLLPEWTELLGARGYASVQMRELVADPERYLKYYSKKVIYSDAAAAQFVPPDKRPLPSTV